MDPIAEYIRQNRDMYTREALDRELLDKGYTPEEIDAAWNSLAPEDAGQQSIQVGGSHWDDYTPPIDGGFVLLCIFNIAIGGFLLLLTYIWFALNMSYNSSGSNSSALTAIGVLIALSSVAAAIALVAFGVSRLKKGWSTRRVAGLLIIGSLLWYLVIIGTCLSTPTLLRQ